MIAKPWFACALLLVALYAGPAHAFRASENAFRLEDSREGNMLLGAEEAEIEAGEVFGTVVLLWGNLAVRGQVKEVVVVGGNVVFHPGAKLTKSLIVMGGSYDSLPGAQVAAGNVVLEAPGPLWRLVKSGANLWHDNINWVAKLFGAASLCFVLWLGGLLLFSFFPSLAEATAGRLVREWPANLLAGMVGTVFVPVLLVLLVISILGIVVLPIYFLLLLVAGVVSYLATALWVGHRLLPPRGGRINAAGFFLGLVSLQLFWAVGVWWALLPMLTLWLFAWGAVLRGTRRLWR